MRRRCLYSVAGGQGARSDIRIVGEDLGDPTFDAVIPGCQHGISLAGSALDKVSRLLVVARSTYMQTVRHIEDIRIAADTIGEAGIEKDVKIPVESFSAALANPEVELMEPVSLHYIVTRENDTIHAAVDVRGRLATQCADCLNPVEYPLDLHFETDYLPAAPDMPEDLEAERQSPTVGYYRKTVELGAYILSETVLALPLRYLCRSDCKGLCAQCGANLNEGMCACEKPADHRLEKLAEFKNKLRRK